MSKQKGTVKWFNNSKGYGFIVSNDKDYFAHFSEINMPGYKFLETGQQVAFNTKQDDKGTKATDISICHENSQE